jgi:adenylate cyclase class IV
MLDAANFRRPCTKVEVKIRLPDRSAYEKVAKKLAAGLRVTHEQENFFFDGPGNELNSKRTVLRLRFYDTDKKALVTIKVCVMPRSKNVFTGPRCLINS